MRQLTASEKIAFLENRVAHLEKQAMFEDIKQKINEKIEAFNGVKKRVSRLFRSAGPVDTLAKEFVKAVKTPEYKAAMKELRAEVGTNPVKQVKYILDARENPQMVRSASLRKNAGLAFFLVNPELIFVAILVIGSVVTWLLHKAGIKRFASHNKEALFGTLLLMVVSYAIGWFHGYISV